MDTVTRMGLAIVVACVVLSAVLAAGLRLGWLS
jgi:hypothetical protein